jgi:hypothetical protein
MSDDAALAVAILRLEERLLEPTVRRSARALGELLARVRVEDFRTRRLDPASVLATHLARRDSPDERSRRSLRSSIWERGEEGWRLVFHQGTSAAGVASS